MILIISTLCLSSAWAGQTFTGGGATKAEACANAKNAASVNGHYETKECMCSERDKDDVKYRFERWVCAVERKD
jgi:hypothetical protein